MKKKFPGLYESSTTLNCILSTPGKFVVSSRSEGLGDVLFAVGHAWLYAKKVGRSLIIDLSSSRYLKDKERNAAVDLFKFPDQFEGVKIVTPERIRWVLRRMFFAHPVIRYTFCRLPAFVGYYNLLQSRLAFLPCLGGDYSLSENMERELIRSGFDLPERFVGFKGCHFDHFDEIRNFILSVRPSEKLEDKLYLFLGKIPSPFIAVHVRYYSPNWEWKARHGEFWHDFDESIGKIIRMIEDAKHHSPDSTHVLLATDSPEVSDAIQRNVPNCVQFPKFFGSTLKTELHYQDIEGLGESAVIEMFALSHADVLVRFPPSESWFSALAACRARKVIM